MSADHTAHVPGRNTLFWILLTTLNRGAHLFTIVPQVWTTEVGDEKVKEVVEEGFRLLKMGWEQDEVALKRSVVGPLIE